MVSGKRGGSRRGAAVVRKVPLNEEIFRTDDARHTRWSHTLNSLHVGTTVMVVVAAVSFGAFWDIKVLRSRRKLLRWAA